MCKINTILGEILGHGTFRSRCIEFSGELDLNGSRCVTSDGLRLRLSTKRELYRLLTTDHDLNRRKISIITTVVETEYEG